MDTAQIIEKIEALKSELPTIFDESQSSNNLDLGWDRFNRWKDRTATIISKLTSPAEAEKLEDASPRVFSMVDPWGNLQKELASYEAHLTALIEEIKKNPEFIIAQSESVDAQTFSTPSALARLEKICRRFHRVAKQLRNRHSDRPTLEIEDEYDVQDLFHALLKVEFDDIRPEEWTPSYAGRSARTDFLLKQEKVIVEIKKTRKDLSDKEIGEQLIIDIERYQAHPDCKTVVCFVYDPEGRMGNPEGIIKDLESRQRESLDLKVIIAPEA
jgi:hypothetical protein